MLQQPMLRSVLPPWAKRFRTDDFDQLRAFVAASSGEHSRVVRGSGRLSFEQEWLTGTSVAVGWVRTDFGTLVRGAVRVPTLHLHVPAGTTYRIGRRRHESNAGAVTFVAPDWQYTLDRPPGAAAAVSVGGEALAAELAARQQDSRFDPVLRTRSIELDAAARATLACALDDFVCSSGLAADRSPESHAEARLVAAVAALLRERAAAVHGQEISANRMADLEAWIDANLAAPISVGRLCAVAGVGERALQKSFESRRGMSPMRFVIERRLAEAHRQLTEAHAQDDVTHIAVQLGFYHTGRFAALYRQAFGESPSQSLRRARRQGRARPRGRDEGGMLRTS
jgi:AraC-like DNA-binding protein